jgi:hypothetical protein
MFNDLENRVNVKSISSFLGESHSQKEALSLSHNHYTASGRSLGDVTELPVLLSSALLLLKRRIGRISLLLPVLFFVSGFLSLRFA